jgi:hypothetical protein
VYHAIWEFAGFNKKEMVTMTCLKKMVLGISLIGVSTFGFAQSSSSSGVSMEHEGVVSQGASQTTVSLGVDYSEGKYGEADKSKTTTVPLIIKYETGPFMIKATIPWVRATGTRAAGGDLASASKTTESGLGDITLGGSYNAYYNDAAKFGIDVGGKIKFATADDSKTLLTTGENDYSIQSDIYKSFGPATVFGTLGWTKKGDPDLVDFKNPWYTSIGVAYKVASATSMGVSYDYRQKVTNNGDPISEASLFLTHKYSKDVKVQAYLVGGFSDASPDVGAGAVVSFGF